ncbi:MAG: DUF2480 family protein [Bacteroidia bacterium]|nr:DUF2480 family protein [Bacteroidia bacterium]
MPAEKEITNRVDSSGLITIDLSTILPVADKVIYDIKDNLYQGLILKEKDFREFVKENDWSFYQDKYVGLVCTADAVIPTWAYMLLTTNIQPFSKLVVRGDQNALDLAIVKDTLSQLSVADYTDKRIVIKGCSDAHVTESAYVEITRLLRPVAKSIMFGEPCSTVPIFKK